MNYRAAIKTFWQLMAIILGYGVFIYSLVNYAVILFWVLLLTVLSFIVFGLYRMNCR